AGVDLVERAPRPGRAAERGRGLYRPPEGARPDHHAAAIRIAPIEELGERLSVADAVRRQVGITPEQTGGVVHTLAVAGEPDRPRGEVQVHQEEHQAPGQVAIDVAHGGPAAIAGDAQVGALVVSEGLVHALVVRDARAEVDHRLLGIDVRVVGRRQLVAADVGLDDGRVVAADLDEQHLEAGALATRTYHRTARAGGVGGVIDRDLPVLGEPHHHVLERRHGRREARLFARWVVGIEEAVRKLGADTRAPVLSDVEDTGAVAEPRQVALDAPRGVALSAGRQPDHHDRELGAVRSDLHGNRASPGSTGWLPEQDSNLQPSG